jgi:hypothetical protein
MPDRDQILQSLAVAALTAAAAVLLCGLLRKGRPAWTAAGMVLGTGLGFCAGCAWLGAKPHWPPREDQDRFLLVLFPAVVLVELVGTLAGKWTWLLRVALAGSAAWILLFGSVYLTDLSGPGSREWTPEQTWLILPALATALIATWTSLATLARRTGGRSVPLSLALVCGGAAVTVMLSGYASGGQLGLPLAAAVAGVMLTSLILARPLDASGVTGVAVIGLFSLLLIGRFFGELKTPHAVILFLAPLACWLSELPLAQRLHPRLRGLSRAALTVLPVVLVVWLAQQKFVDAIRTPATTKEASIEDYMNFGK